MSPTHTVPYARRLREPACPGTLSTHHLVLDDSRLTSPLLMAMETDSPLFLTYQATLQAFRIENLGRYVEGHEPNIGMTRTLIRTIANELVPDILQLFDQLGGADLLYNIRNRRTFPTTRPSGGLTASPASSSSSGSSVSSPTCRRPRPRPSSVSSIYDVCPLRHTRFVPLNPTPAGSAANPIEVESYHASASSSEVDAERSFRIDPYSLARAIEFAEEERVPHSPIILGPLSQDHPHYHEACFECCVLGHIRIHCQWYQCPFCMKGAPGHKQSRCPERHGHTRTPSIPIVEESLPNGR